MKLHNYFFSISLKKSIFLLGLFFFFLTSNIFGQTSSTFTTTGTWTCPAGVTSVTVECWGGGGGASQGLGGGTARGGGGGGGGSYAKTNSITVTPGVTYSYTVGTGGAGNATAGGAGNPGNPSQMIIGTTTGSANGGGGGQANGSGGAGGTGGIGGTLINGGAGATNNGNNGGGGGAGAPTTGTANAGTSSTGGVGANGGGSGGNGSVAGNDAVNGAGFAGTQPGGGAGGSFKNTSNASISGGGGQVKISYVCPSFGSVSAGSNQTLAACTTTTTVSGSAVPSGMTGTWTVSPAGPTIVSPNSASSSITGMALGTSYTFTWTISNGVCGTSASSITVVTQFGIGCWNYCSSNASTTDYSYISNVNFYTINNTSSGCASYTNFTNVSTTLNPGSTYTLTITKLNNCTGTTSFTGRFAAWIDWNNDGDFNDVGEQVLTDAAASNGPVSSNVTVPLTATLGTTRMRCIFREGTVAPPNCGVYTTWGETEDYSIIIQPSTACSGTPSPGNLTTSSSVSCASAGISSTIYLTTALTETGYTYQWQQSSDNITYANVSGETNDTTFVLLTTSSTYYRLAVTCINSALSAPSNTVIVNICPVSCNDYIQNQGETGVDCGGPCQACTVPINDCAEHPILISQCSQSFSVTQAQMQAATNDANCSAGGIIAPCARGNFDCKTSTLSGQVAGYDFNGSIENSLFWTFTPTTSCSYNIAITATNCTGAPGQDAAQYHVYRVSDRLPTGTILQYYGGSGAFVNTVNLSITTVAYQPILIAIDGNSGSYCDLAVQITAGASCPCTIAPLPIELLTFFGKKENNNIKISWTTASETNNSHFNVMRLNEETSNFEQIAKINGKGNSNAIQYYNFVDTDVKEKTYYYQLEQVDFNGNINRSKIISINNTLDQNAEFKLIPNPVESEKTCKVVLNTMPEKDLTLQVIDINGVVKYESKIFPENSTIEFPTNFTSGIYLVKLSCNEFTHTKRLMVK